MRAINLNLLDPLTGNTVEAEVVYTRTRFGTILIHSVNVKGQTEVPDYINKAAREVMRVLGDTSFDAKTS